MSILSKTLLRYSVIPIKILVTFYFIFGGHTAPKSGIIPDFAQGDYIGVIKPWCAVYKATPYPLNYHSCPNTGDILQGPQTNSTKMWMDS